MSLGNEEAQVEQAASAEKKQGKPFSGFVVRVDGDAKTFVISNQNGPERFVHVSDKTIVCRGNDKLEFSGITVGSYTTGTSLRTGPMKHEALVVRISEETPQPKEDKPVKFSGSIENVSPEKNTFDLKKEDGSVSHVSVVAATKIQKDGAETNMSALKVGMKVSGTAIKLARTKERAVTIDVQ